MESINSGESHGKVMKFLSIV